MNTAFTTATERSIDVSNGMEPSEALILMQDYCIANPEASVGVAAAEVTAKLIGKGDDVLGQGDAERHLGRRGNVVSAFEPEWRGLSHLDE